MIASIPSATVLGVDGSQVFVEVHVSNGLPSFNIVGLPDIACREARDRVRAALLSSGLPWPQQRVTVNLAPSGLKKVGTALDLPIAVGLLVASEKIQASAIDQLGFIGELGLDGSVRDVDAVVPLVDAIETDGIVVPHESAEQAELIGRHKVRGIANLCELIGALTEAEPWPDYEPVCVIDHLSPKAPDFSEVRGQPMARWAIEVAAAGGHNTLLMGQPGSGKTMLATRLPGLLPPLDSESGLAATRIHSAAGMLRPGEGLLRRPPLRSPHHTASLVAMVGGGAGVMRPGEISLAHGGVLFLDELCEFPRGVLEALRTPLEDGEVRISRSTATVNFPARFQLIAATNPCPCGEGTDSVACKCSPAAAVRYRSKLSGPLLDRFDLRLKVGRLSSNEFMSDRKEESTAEVAQRVTRVRERAAQRGVDCNARLSGEQLREHASLDERANQLLRKCLDNGRLTGRGLLRVRRVALTISDLAGDDGPLTDSHVSAALALHADVSEGIGK